MNFDVMIMSDEEKRKYLKENCEKIHTFKLYTVEEMKKLYDGNLHPLSLYETVHSFHLLPEVANTLLSFVFDVKEVIGNEKIDLIYNIRKHLEEKGYIQKSLFFRSFFINKKILFYRIDMDEKLEKIKKELEKNNEVFFQDEKANAKMLDIQPFTSIEEEVLHVAVKITDLLLKGININHIKIHLCANDYSSVIFRIFHEFQIPYEKEKVSLYTLPLVKEFLSNLENQSLEEALQVIDEREKNQKNQKIYEQLLTVCEPYMGMDLDKETFLKVLLYELKQRKIQLYPQKDVVTFVSKFTKMEENEYLFILGVNQDYFPKTYQDDEYLLDKDKEILGLIPSWMKNKNEKEKSIQWLYQTNHLFLSYKEFSNVSYVKSSLIEELSIKEKIENYDYTNYHYNQFLHAKMMDHYMKYAEKNKDYDMLQELKNEEYRSYDSSFTGIDKTAYHDYIKHKILLSYSTLTTFFKCPFRFYMSKILKIYDKKETTSLLVGNIVHEVLCKVLKENIQDVDSIIVEEMKDLPKTLKNEFYQKKWKEEIKKLIQIIRSHMDNTEFQNTYLEDTFDLLFDRELQITLEGKIDKVLTYEKDGFTYAMIIDYKTGTIDTDFNPIIYGLNMQLMIYYYLLYKTKPNIRPAGFYYQNVIKNLMNRQEGKLYEELLMEAYKLQGYTSKDLILLPHLVKDLDYSFIKGLKLKKDGTFSTTSKVLDEIEIQKLTTIVEKNILKAFENIEKANFSIEPKRIGTETMTDSTGCKFCPYQDICYRKAKDFVSLKKHEKLDFLLD